MKQEVVRKKTYTLLAISFLAVIGMGWNISAATPSNETYTFLIISPEEFTSALEPLVDHKTAHGITTKHVSLEEIHNDVYCASQGRDEAERIKYYIQHAMEDWNTSYVMLVGTEEVLPSRPSVVYFSILPFHMHYQKMLSMLMMHTQVDSGQTWTYVTDLYYADIYDNEGNFVSWDTNNNGVFGEKNDDGLLDHVDFYPDIAVGRLLCATSEEVNRVVTKIITYETSTAGSSWFNHMIVCGGDTHSLWRDLLFKLLPPLRGLSTDNRIAFEGEYMGDVAAGYFNDVTVTRLYTTGSLRKDALPLTVETMNQAISQGAGFLLLSGHGYAGAWGTHPPFLGKIWMPFPSLYQSSDIKALTNQEKLPIAVISACSCGNFNETPHPFAWEWVNHEEGGAIASFACTTLGTLLPTTLCTESLNGHLALNVLYQYAQGNDILGDIWKNTIVDYLQDEKALALANLTDAVWVNYLNVEQWILFGDPTLKIGGY